MVASGRYAGLRETGSSATLGAGINCAEAINIELSVCTGRLFYILPYRASNSSSSKLIYFLYTPRHLSDPFSNLYNRYSVIFSLNCCFKFRNCSLSPYHANGALLNASTPTSPPNHRPLQRHGLPFSGYLRSYKMPSSL
jgi:hypothetical protein